jgi:hypothetical protein
VAVTQVTTQSGKSIVAVRTLTSTAYEQVIRGVPRELAGARTTVPTPEGGFLVLHFQGDAICNDGNGPPATGTWCNMTFLVDGKPALPDDQVVLTNENPTTQPFYYPNQLLNLQRVSRPLHAGPHTVEVQWYVGMGTPGASFQLQSWSLEVQAVK